MKLTLTPADRRRLRGKGQLLQPVLKVGKDGVTDGLLASVETEIAHHELIKIKFVNFKEEKHELVESIANRTNSALVQVVGHVALLYRPKSNPVG